MKPKVAVPIATRLLRGALALSVLALALAAGQALASTAANTRITNTATVNYNDAGGVAQPAATASATVTVTLVQAAVVLTSPANQTVLQGAAVSLGYTVTATANGPDTYAVGPAFVDANVSAASGVAYPANVTLGGTTLAADATNGATSITAPYDFNPDGVVNGIETGDTIVIGGNAYAVSGVTENPGANTTTIDLGAAISGGTVAAGSIVGERATFALDFTAGSINLGGSGTHTVTTTVTASAGGPATAQDPATVVTVVRPSLSVAKNVSTDNGASYALTGSAPPGTTLIYRVVAENTGPSDATAVTFADAIPAYLTYVAGSAKYATNLATAYGSATDLTDAADGDGYGFAGGNISYVPPAPTSTVAGTVPGPAGVLILFYQATIN